MSSNPSDVEIVELDDLEIKIEQWPWEFAISRREEIDRHFARLKQQRPLWNGRVLLLHRYDIFDRKFEGACFETDYASLMAWCDWDFPDKHVYNFYAAAALRAGDGAYIVGEMAPHTAGAGELYFPCGTPEPADIVNGNVVDLHANMCRELLEETGLAVADLDVSPTWRLVRDQNFIALIKEAAARQNAHELRDCIIRNLETDPQPELSDIHILRGPADLNARMPLWVRGHLEDAWKCEKLR
jgi:hypothetical protein